MIDKNYVRNMEYLDVKKILSEVYDIKADYRLLKDLPGLKAGAEFYMIARFGKWPGMGAQVTYGCKDYPIEYIPELVENNPEWFEPIK